MLICKICKRKVSSVESFFLHLRYSHYQTERIRCPHEKCICVYPTNSSLKKHLKSHCVESDSISVDDFELTENVTNISAEDLKQNELKGTVTDIVLNLKNDMLRNALELLSDEQITIKKSLEVSRKSFDCYSKAFLSLKKLENQLVGETKILNDFYDFFLDPSSVQSEFKLKNALINAGVYISSKDYTISSTNVLTFLNGVPKLREEKKIVKMFDIPRILEKFFNLPNIMSEIYNFVTGLQSCHDGSISNIVQSPLWKKLLSLEKSDDPSVLYLPINIFFDDFEPLNVVGSHSGAYKIGGTYMGLPFLPDHIVSKLEYIFPVALFFSEDRILYGNEKLFEPIVNMLNGLYYNGINVNFGKIRKVKFIVALVIGDNLGLNGILSFSEGFNHNYYCRFCKLKKHLLQKLSTEDAAYLRNCKNYCEDLLIQDFSLTGIKIDSVFNKICRFHVTRNFSVDILHDFLEGVCHYDLCNIILNFLTQNVFMLDELNASIRFHNYGPFAKNKKIDPITMEMLKNKKLRTTGEEMLILVVNFAFIIGHRINKYSSEWKLYLVLRQILSIVTAKTVHIQTYQLLSSLISTHHNLYLQCFPDDNLKPKHHFMVHYPRIMQAIGPLSSVSCMRYESFHKKFKNISKVVSCRINLLTTFAKKIEFQFSHFFLYFEGTLKKVKFGLIDDADKIFLYRKYNFRTDSKKTVLSSFVDVGGILVKRNSVIQTGIEIDDTPNFGLVTDVIIENENIISFGCQKLTNLGFYEHLHAYSVHVENEFFICKFSKNYLQTVSYIFDAGDRKLVSF